MPAKLSLQARLINLLSELDDAGVEAKPLDLRCKLDFAVVFLGVS